MTSIENEVKQMEDYEKQHINNYQNAIIEIIKNNTKSLIDDDIASLFKEPPLDSMDTIKLKLLELAKKEQIILDSSQTKGLLSNFRKKILEEFEKIKELRNSTLIEKVISFVPSRNSDVINFTNKDLEGVNKNIKLSTNKFIKASIKENLIENLDSIYQANTIEHSKESIKKDFSKFMNSTYQKQIKENMAIKIMVKDRTLVNGVAEQGERYIFTKSNSHIFDEEQENTK